MLVYVASICNGGAWKALASTTLEDVVTLSSFCKGLCYRSFAAAGGGIDIIIIMSRRCQQVRIVDAVVLRITFDGRE